MDREEFIIEVYCLVDDFFRDLTKSKRLRQRGPDPALTDVEIITMQIVGEFLVMDGDKNIWEYFKLEPVFIFNYANRFNMIFDMAI